MLRGSSGDSLKDVWNSVSLLFAFFCIGMVFKTELLLSPSDEESQESQATLGGFNDAKRWYIPLVLVKLTALTLLMEIGISYSFSFVSYIIASLSLFSLLVLICGRPYLRCFDNLRVILCEIAVLYASGLPLIHRFVEIDEAYELFLLYVLQAIIFLFLVLALIRVFLLYAQLLKNGRKVRTYPSYFKSTLKGNKGTRKRWLNLKGRKLKK